MSPTQPEPPAIATLKAFATAEEVSAVHCETVQQDALARGLLLKRPPGADQIDRRTKLYVYPIMTLTLPVVSPDGTEAMAYVADHPGPMTGSGFLWLLRRGPDGAWTIAARVPVWEH